MFALTGDVPALMHLAHCYSHGSGVEVDYKKAFKCHSSAAESGPYDPQGPIGIPYSVVFKGGSTCLMILCMTSLRF